VETQARTTPHNASRSAAPAATVAQNAAARLATVKNAATIFAHNKLSAPAWKFSA
jgi:hypothetical protein